VDASLFEPDPGQRGGGDGAITVVALSRLVYRKGIDLLAAVLPALCHNHPNVQVRTWHARRERLSCVHMRSALARPPLSPLHHRSRTLPPRSF
jgi:glycosyltransferase involved in cell wall biosynthesis